MMTPGGLQQGSQVTYVYGAINTDPTHPFTVTMPSVATWDLGVALQTACEQKNREIEADAIRNDRTISRHERRKRLSLLRKGKRT
jgi:hypothetical protein